MLEQDHENAETAERSCPQPRAFAIEIPAMTNRAISLSFFAYETGLYILLLTLTLWMFRFALSSLVVDAGFTAYPEWLKLMLVAGSILVAGGRLMVSILIALRPAKSSNAV